MKKYIFLCYLFIHNLNYLYTLSQFIAFLPQIFRSLLENNSHAHKNSSLSFMLICFKLLFVWAWNNNNLLPRSLTLRGELSTTAKKNELYFLIGQVLPRHLDFNFLCSGYCQCQCPFIAILKQRSFKGSLTTVEQSNKFLYEMCQWENDIVVVLKFCKELKQAMSNQ